MLSSRLTLAALILTCMTPACAVRKLAVNQVANALSGSGSTWASDPDPELVRDAVPFALKTYESILEQTPRHRGLLVATSAGFAQYAYGFLAHDAEVTETRDLASGLAIRARARRLLVRGRDYGLRALEVRHPGVTAELRAGRSERLAEAGKKDIEALFWTAACWGGAISILKDDADLISDLPVVEAMLRRVIALDETFDQGAAHEVMVSLEAGLAAGSQAAAKEHFDRAVELSAGLKAAPFVTYAETIAVANQDRKLFIELLDRALAIDLDREPRLRLANVMAQRRARWLSGRVDDLFAE